MKRVIVNGDDFGLAAPVNEAIVEAHRRGVLTSASLMVGAAAMKDAVERARESPSLRVGLHLVLVEGRSILPPSNIISKAAERNVPLLMVFSDTYQTAKQIEGLEPLLTKDDTDKIALLKQLVLKHVKLEEIFKG